MKRFLTCILLLVASQTLANDCGGWNSDWDTTKEFFESASLEVVAACLAVGVDPTVRGRYGYTPLHWGARFNEDPASITLLLDAGAEVMARSSSNLTPLHWAAWFNENPAIITLLVDAGADVNTLDDFGATPLHYAAENNQNPAVTSLLLEIGAKLNAQNKFLYTPLHEAAGTNQNPAVIVVLLEAGADLFALGGFGSTPPTLCGRPQSKTRCHHHLAGCWRRCQPTRRLRQDPLGLCQRPGRTQRYRRLLATAGRWLLAQRCKGETHRVPSGVDC